MLKPAVHRSLYGSEYAFIGGDAVPLVISASFDTALDVDRLTDAFKRLCHEHPLLRSRLTTIDGEWAFVLDDRCAPAIVDTRKSSPGRVEDLAGAPFDRNTALSSLTILQMNTSTVVVLSIDHIIGDGLSLIALLRKLGELYGLPTPCPRSPGASHGIPKPVDAFLQGAFGEKDLVDYTTGVENELANISIVRVDSPPSGGLAGGLGFGLLETSLNPRETAGLRRVSKRWGVRFSSVLTAVMAKALQTSAGNPQGDDVVVLLIPVDLRRRVSPRAEPLHMTNFAGAVGLRDVPRFSVEDEVRDISRMYDEQVSRSLTDHDAERGVFAMQRPEFPDTDDLTCVVSNLGEIDGEIQFGDVNPSRVGVSTPAPGRTPIAVTHTYAGNLSVNLSYDSHIYGRAAMSDVMEKVNSIFDDVLPGSGRD